MSERRGPGRPAGKRRPHQVYSYLSDEELEALRALARERGEPLSLTVRGAILAACREKITGGSE